MSAKGGRPKGRPPRSNVSRADRSVPVAFTYAASGGAATHGDKKGDVSPSPVTAVDTAAELPAVHALLHNTANPRLEAVQRLLRSVVATAATVVRGTESQRRFTSTFTEFCTSALRHLADIEEAVFETANPGRRASDAGADEIAGIADDAFLKQVAAYVASYSSSLGLAYLEHVALAALEREQQQQHRKRERASASASATARPGKSSRTQSAVSGSGGSATAGSGSVAFTMNVGAAAAHAAFDSLGLIDAQDTLREALHTVVEQERAAAKGAAAGAGSGTQAGTAAQRQRGGPAATAALAAQYASTSTAGLFVSKAGPSSGSSGAAAGASGGQHTVYDLRNPQLKLTSIPELATRLQPWTLPLPASGVLLERVTMERERRGGGATASATAGGGPAHPSSNTAEAAVQTTLDVCLAATPMDLLRQYEARETALAASSTAPPAGPYSVVPYAGKRGAVSGGSPRPATAPLFAPPASTAAQALEGNMSVNHSSSSGGGGNNGGGGLASSPSPGVEGDAVVTAQADAESLDELTQYFFPAVRENKTLTCLPPFVMANVSHFGVSRMEFVYTTAPPPAPSAK